MAKPRAAQFAKDIGVSTKRAKELINEGRRRKDGGSSIIEETMLEVRGMGKAYTGDPREVKIR